MTEKGQRIFNYKQLQHIKGILKDGFHYINAWDSKRSIINLLFMSKKKRDAPQRYSLSVRGPRKWSAKVS
jgi:hypothetical protein